MFFKTRFVQGPERKKLCDNSYLSLPIQVTHACDFITIAMYFALLY